MSNQMKSTQVIVNMSMLLIASIIIGFKFDAWMGIALFTFGWSIMPQVG